MSLYEITNSQTFLNKADGERVMLCNFAAIISEETRVVDGTNVETFLTLVGKMPGDDADKPVTLPSTVVPASAFPSMSWVMQAWGCRCVVSPGSSVKEDLRAAIQLTSKPTVHTIYKHIGWTTINGKPAYLHANGAITAKGNNPATRVALPPELARYDLTPNPKIAIKDAVAATLALTLLAREDITWPLLAATIAPAMCSCDFALHLAGRTGTYKSELASLFQSHYGPGLDARHLPASWSSTSNALEALAYTAANAPIVIDDFVPSGSSWQIRNYHTTADKIIRAQGNQAGRARLTDISALQTTMYPRGIILSTGEDVPDGHSVRARMLILELSPGDIDPANLSKAQANRPFYSQTTAALIQSLAESPVDLTARSEKLRNQYVQYGHTRTPSTIAKLIAVAEAFIQWCASTKTITAQKAAALTKEATEAIIAAGAKQSFYLESADPCDMFCAGFRHLVAASLAHIRTLNGGVPRSPTMLGWSEESALGDMPTFKSHGPCIGWVNWDSDELFLEANLAWNMIRKTAGSELAITKQTMFKRLKDAALLTRTDDTRQRNTIRITAESHARQVLAFACSQLLETNEKP